MSSISGIGGASSAWADASTSRASALKARMFTKVDSDGSGTVDKTELQSMLDRIAKKTGDTAADAGQMLTQMDSNGDGSLNAGELAAGMKGLMPQPKSTVDFAQQRDGERNRANKGIDRLFRKLDTNSSGGLDATELNKLLDKMASASGASTGVSSAAAAAADAAVFKALDTDGNGKISKRELKAALKPSESSSDSTAAPAGSSAAGPAGAPPPGGPGGIGGPPRRGGGGRGGDGDGDGDDSGSRAAASTSGTASTSSSTSSTAATDPLDTNGDGVVSAQERTAGALKAMMKAMDGNQDGSVSQDELKSFIAQLTQASGKVPGGSTSAPSGGSAGSQGTQARPSRLNNSALAALVTSEYGKAAANPTANGAVDLAA